MDLDERLSRMEVRHLAESSAASPERSLRILTMDDVHRAVDHIRPLAMAQQVRWCVVGGAAVMIHLTRHGVPAAAARASHDVDIAADRLLELPQQAPRWPLLTGGYRLDLAGTTVDWIVRRPDSLYPLYQRMVASATEAVPGVLVPPAACIVATKILLSASAIRPKDQTDLRLLLGSGAAGVQETVGFLERTIASVSLLRGAIQRLHGYARDLAITAA